MIFHLLCTEVQVHDKPDPEPVDVPFILPHELIHELFQAGPLQVGIAKSTVSIVLTSLLLKRLLTL